MISPTFDTPSFAKQTGSAAIFGAGPTGLSTAWRLAKHGWKVTLIEKEKELGGHGGTHTIHGYDVDNGPHKLYPQVPCAKPFIDHFVGKDLLTMSKKSSVYVRETYIPFPFGLGDLFHGLGLMTGLRCGIGYGLGKIERVFRGSPSTYTDFVIAQYGRYAHELVFRQVAEKLWGDPDTLHVQLAKTRIIAPNVWELIGQLLFRTRNKPKLSADEFYYPRHGLRQLWESVGTEIETHGGTIIRETKPTHILSNKTGGFEVTYQGNDTEHTIQSDVIISTIPLKAALHLLDPAPPSQITDAMNHLAYSSLLVVYLVVDTPRLLPVNWIFFPEKNLHFARLSEQKGFSETMVPKDKTVLMVEIPLARPAIASMDRECLIAEAIEQLRRVGILKPIHHIVDMFTGYNDSIYPIYDTQSLGSLETILSWTDNIPNFYLNGRLGLFCYNNMDHSMEMGLALGDHIASQQPAPAWIQTRKSFYDYKIVD